ncbi:hypothetical protein VTK26DRAFT_3429 [Humicola hyalothermophila]
MPQAVSESDNSIAPPASCPLEALNPDCLIAVLSTSNSLNDLASFIRASPAIYNCFLLAKAPILCSVLANELGPAIRDLLIVSLTHGFDISEAEKMLEAEGAGKQTFDFVIGGYREVLQVDQAPWVPALDLDTAVDMARLSRVFFYFADLYADVRIKYFTHVLDPPCGNRSLSRTERRRIAQALMRRQVFTKLRLRNRFDPDRGAHFLAAVLSLFESWELEQASEMLHFVADLATSIEALTNPGRVFPSRHHPPGQPHGHAHVYDLLALHARLSKEQQASDGQFLAKLMASPGVCGGKIQFVDNGACSSWLKSSHRWLVRETGPPGARLAAEDVELPAEDAATRVAFRDDSPTEAPWAWVHAWDGHKVNRWGVALVCGSGLLPAPPPDGDWDERLRMDGLTESWRWLGMVFWDKDRAEELLAAKVLEGCSTGWLWRYSCRQNVGGGTGP